MVSKKIKMATKEKIKPHLERIKEKLKNPGSKIDLKYFKEVINVEILDKRLVVLFEKGRYRNHDNAKKTIEKFTKIVNNTTEIFLKKTEQISSAKIYLEKNEIDPRKILVDRVVMDFSQELKKLSREGLKIEFIEDLNPIIDKYYADFKKKINYGEPTEN